MTSQNISEGIRRALSPLPTPAALCATIQRKVTAL
jgi:hypothetical protein